MKILILNWRDINHPLAGGAEIVTHEYAKGWVRQGYSVYMIASSWKGAKNEEVIDGIKIIRKGSHYTVHIYAFLYYMRYLKNIIDVVIDQIHFVPFFTPLYVRKKIIAFIHETAEEIWFKNHILPISLIGYIVEPLFYKLYKNTPFMTVSRSTQKDLMRFGIPASNITIIQNGVRIARSQENKEKIPTIIFLARLSKDKGVEDALHAHALIVRQFRDAKLWIVGKAEQESYSKKLVNMCKKLGTDKNVRFWGYVNEQLKSDLLRRAWILVHPSDKEGWGLTILEAAMQKTPSVGYNVSGLSDSIIPNKTGFICKKGSISDLAKLITKLIDDHALYENISNCAYDNAKKFTWDKSIEASIKYIRSL